MRKMFVFVIILVSVFISFGCQSKSDIKYQFSEITKEYYSGQSKDGRVSASISVGEREEPYIIDGKHNPNLEFSLLIVKIQPAVKESLIEIDFFSGETFDKITLEFNPMNNTYMVDLGYSLKSGIEYRLRYKEIYVDFLKTSDEFKVDYNKAIELSLLEMGENISNYYSGNLLQAECYLKVLKYTENFEDLYWAFTIVGQNGKRNNVLIDTKTGEIILSN